MRDARPASAFAWAAPAAAVTSLFLAAAPAAAGFIDDKKDVVAVVVERARSAPGDAQRALKAGENALRRLHDDFKLAKSTPPTSLDGDVGEMTAAVAKMRVLRSRGQTPPPDPRAEKVLAVLWDRYEAAFQALLEDVRFKRDGGASESAVYWESLKDHDALVARTLEAAAYNPPPGGKDAETHLSDRRWELLKRLEDPARVRGRAGCVAGGEAQRPASFDVGPFYRAAGLLPGTNPLRKEALELPPRCRTVTRREAGTRLILRATAGRGTVALGAESKPLSYDYVIVPPEVPYMIENAGDGPLAVEAVALLP